MRMRLGLVILCLVALGGPASAQQYGVSSQRDMYGNIARDAGTNSQKGVNQATPNSNGLIRNAPIQPAINPAKPVRTNK
jgi:hypothetical protein